MFEAIDSFLTVTITSLDANWLRLFVVVACLGLAGKLFLARRATSSPYPRIERIQP